METQDGGLSTKEALHILHREIELVLHQFKSSQKMRKPKSYIKDSLHHSSQYSTLSWISVLCHIWTFISLFLVSYTDEYEDEYLMFQAIVVLILGLTSLVLEIYDNYLRHNEIPARIEAILEKIRKETDTIEWSSNCYPNICSPMSPCITLQWTYRDNELVNLPWPLLVKGDIICMRPGQHSPGYCEAVEKNSEIPILHAKEVFAPVQKNSNEIFTAPKIRQPLKCRKYKLLETPYLNNLKICLEQSLDKPITQYEQQRHFILRRISEFLLLPIILVALYLILIVRYFYWDSRLGGFNPYKSFLIVPVSTVFPLIPYVFPIAWKVLNYFGIARFKTMLDSIKSMGKCQSTLEEDGNAMITDDLEVDHSFKDILNNFMKILYGNPDIMVRTTNIVHVLGSVTALCCCDKKGILSWPNPTAEKVFFLHNNKTVSPVSSSENMGDMAQEGDNESIASHCFHPDTPNAAVAEVLDLTHNHSDPFKLHFDDQDWDKHISSLKPLGLAILLNTCNIETQDHYAAFCSHISCEAIYSENLVPVTIRRCLCELAKEIGFADQAQNIFSLEQQLSTYRHLQPELVRRDNKYARSLHLPTKLKFPFPHMFAVVVKELSSGSMQLLSEGTADIILDSCIDYWDGRDLCPLLNSDRKKIKDFYQRCSLTAYCTAFAYRPLNKCLSNKLSEVYLELPSDSHHLYVNQRSPTPVHWECKSVLEPKIHTALGQFCSTDSLLYNECPPVEVSDAESCFQMQCNQVFIGMVTMQYQALPDIVQLIEQLERACIRFVHFSKENELRSRVFSEKMGLESGWNCHISLLSDRNSNLETSRTVSFSAPSGINLEHSTVRFDKEVEKFNDKNDDDQDEVDEKYNSQENLQNNADLNNTHDWQSLSCLTDSTEHSAPINFDMSNRAKLPRGIDKIRPHIESIDNVPLLVSLFTDCTPNAIREMLHIMQDYGEIVCILGSSANCDNVGILMQADASIAVEPLYPQVCQRYKVFEKIDCISPNDLATELNSIACSLYLKREDPISLYHLIMESRHYMKVLWNCVQFWISCCITITVLQIMAILFMLPLPLSFGQVLWLCFVVIPLLSLSLMGCPLDPGIMKKPQGKKQVAVNLNVFLFILWCYGIKFIPTIIVTLISHMGFLAHHCMELCSHYNCTCLMYHTPFSEDNNTFQNGWSEYSWTLTASRLFVMMIILIHLVTISIGFVHREYSLLKKLPYTNQTWVVAVSILLCVQIGYFVVSLLTKERDLLYEDQLEVPIWIWLYSFFSPLLIFPINEIVKHHEIKVNKRFQKRARLDFGTKLGMNSPF